MSTMTDPLITLLPREAQTQAARHAQDGFALAFRLTLEATPETRQKAMLEAAARLEQWIGEADAAGTQALRAALLLGGLDQWGLAYSQIFGAQGMSGLGELVAALRGGKHGAAALDAMERIDAAPECAFSFKAELRKAIHLALWHAMIAEEDREGAVAVLKQVGGMMLGLVEKMPELGWIIVANTLADIQIRCLAHGLAADGLAQEMTEQLFGALKQQLPPEQRDRIMSAATQTVIAWQQSTRSSSVH